MSNLYENYKNLKSQNSNRVYLFKNGIFYIAIDSDALILQEKLNIKTTTFNEQILKCGFPINSLNMYLTKLASANVDFKFIDNKYDTVLSPDVYLNDTRVQKTIDTIKNLDIESLTPKIAYKTLIELQDILREVQDAIN